jgi:hypothetical protein
MFVFGLGIGSVMQVLVIAVQNAVDYKDLGTATSGATYFRSIGGSFGTAVFGSIFSNRLAANLALYLGGIALPAGMSSSGLSPEALSELPPAAHEAFIHAYADALQTVFLAAAPVAALAFLLSWLLPEVKLRKTVATTDPGQTVSVRTDPSPARVRGRGVGEPAHVDGRLIHFHPMPDQA